MAAGDASAAAASAADFVLRINCGSDRATYVDTEQRVWSADNYYTNGASGSTTTQGGGAGNEDDWPVFQTYRAEGGVWLWGLLPNGRTLLYTLPVPEAGTYEVTLFFTSKKDNAPNSIWFVFMSWFFGGTATTSFDVNAGGTKVFSSEDVLASPSEVAQQQHGAVTRSLRTTANRKNNNEIQLEFIPKGREAYVSAIEVRSLEFSEESNTCPWVFVDAGGEAPYKDSAGNTWEPDASFLASPQTKIFKSTKNIENAFTSLQTMYKSERYTENQTPLKYEIPLPNSKGKSQLVDVTIHMAELFVDQPGGRVLDIYLEGALVWQDVDLVAKAEDGSNHVAFQFVQTKVAVADGKLSIEIQATVRDAKVNGIAVYLRDNDANCPIVVASPPPPVPAPVTPPVAAPVTPPNPDFEEILINAGGDALTDFLGRKWAADKYFSGGDTFSDGRFDVKGSQDDYLYHTERYGEFSYQVPVPKGDYEIILHMAELYWESQGNRLFNVAVEGQKVFSNVDIVQLAGSNWKAVTLETPQTISDGFVSISFTNSAPQKIDNPKLSGIEIKLIKDHLAHAVANGPYFATDSNGDGKETIQVDGTLSHT